jgi:type III pantothenate kinase
MEQAALNTVIDAGNSHVKIAWFKDSTLVETHIFQGFTQQIISHLEENNARHILISSVIEIPADFFTPLKETTIIYLDHNTPLPIHNRYQSPQTLGYDRLANAVGAVTLFPNQNSLIIDCGTCLKFDFINLHHQYMGGAISPGFSMRFKAMHDYTHKLPFIESQRTENLVGTTTKESMVSGAFNGMLAEIRGIAEQYRFEFNNVNAILTGGDHRYFADALKNNIFANPDLTLIGLNSILNHNLNA